MRAYLIAFAMICVVSESSAWGRPPAGADMSLSPWYESLKVPNNQTASSGLSCCSIADCRPVRYRMADDHYEALIDTQTFGTDAPNKWLRVPDEVIIKNKDNPTGEGIVCFHLKSIRCFVPASGT